MKWSGNPKHFINIFIKTFIQCLGFSDFWIFRIFHFRIFIFFYYISSKNLIIEILRFLSKKRFSDVEIVIWCLLTISLNDLWAQLILSAIFNWKWPLEILITYIIIFAHNIKTRETKESLISLYFSTYFPFKYFTWIPITYKQLTIV